MAKQANSNKGGWNKVVEWYARNAYTVQMVYSLGASVVIVGALFKILHWPGASYVLMAGMFTEAFLFAIGIFEKPHATYHWENVFPQLIGDETKELLGGNGVNGVQVPEQQQLQQQSVPALDDNEMSALKAGIQNLQKSANQIAQLADVTTASEAFAHNMTAAANVVGKFGISQNSLVEATQGLTATVQNIGTDMQAALAASKGFGATVNGVNEQTSALQQQTAALVQSYQQQIQNLNAAYALQLKNLQAQSAAYAQMAADTDKLGQALNAGAQASADFVQGAQRLSAQVADLNKIYGGMLNALA